MMTLQAHEAEANHGLGQSILTKIVRLQPQSIGCRLNTEVAVRIQRKLL